MKRFCIILMVLVLSVSLVACGSNETVDGFFAAMKTYDRDEMKNYLSEFPDNSRYVYIDDIFNDQRYIDIYRALYSSIEYEIIDEAASKVTVEVTMPNVQMIYTQLSAIVLSMAMEDAELNAKLNENEYNGVILVQEFMYSKVSDDSYEVPMMTQQFVLTLAERDGKTKILCDDELRALITGNFFLSKNRKKDVGNFGGAD